MTGACRELRVFLAAQGGFLHFHFSFACYRVLLCTRRCVTQKVPFLLKIHVIVVLLRPCCTDILCKNLGKAKGFCHPRDLL